MSALRFQRVRMVTVDSNGTDLFFFVLAVLDGQEHGAADGGDANTEDALLGAGDGEAKASSRGSSSAASEGVQYAGQEGKVLALQITCFIH